MVTGSASLNDLLVLGVQSPGPFAFLGTQLRHYLISLRNARLVVILQGTDHDEGSDVALERLGDLIGVAVVQQTY
jgi:hypothetical protein